MRRRPCEQSRAPGPEPRKRLDMAEPLHPVEEGVALQERRVGGIDQRITRAVEIGAAALLLERLLQPLERNRDLLRHPLIVRLGVGISRRGHDLGESRYVVGPGAIDGALHRILRMQPRRDRLIEVLGDRVRFEQRHAVVDAQDRHLLVRGNGEEPIGPVVAVDVAKLEVDPLLAQHDRGTLHPGASLKADQQVFRHGGLRSGSLPILYGERCRKQ